MKKAKKCVKKMKLTEYFGLLNELSSEMILGEWTQSVCNTCISVATDNLLPVNC